MVLVARLDRRIHGCVFGRFHTLDGERAVELRPSAQSSGVLVAELLGRTRRAVGAGCRSRTSRGTGSSTSSSFRVTAVGKFGEHAAKVVGVATRLGHTADTATVEQEETGHCQSEFARDRRGLLTWGKG